MASAGDHRVGFSHPDELRGFTDRLSGCSARGHAVEVRSLRFESFRDVERSELGFLFEFWRGGHPGVRFVGPCFGIEGTRLVVPRGDIRGHVRLVVEDAFSCSEVHTDPCRIDRVLVELCGFECVLARCERIAGGESGGRVKAVVFDEVCEIEIGDLRGEVGREGGCVEVGDRRDRALSVEQAFPDSIDIRPQWGDPSGAGDDDALVVGEWCFGAHSCSTTRGAGLFFVVAIFVVVVLVVVLAERVWIEDADEAVFEAALTEVDDQSEFEFCGAERSAERVAVS